MQTFEGSNYAYRHEFNVKLGVPMNYVNDLFRETFKIGFSHFNVIKWNKRQKKLTAILVVQDDDRDNSEKAHDEPLPPPRVDRIAIYDCRRRRVKEFKGEDIADETTVKNSLEVYNDYWEKLNEVLNSVKNPAEEIPEIST